PVPAVLSLAGAQPNPARGPGLRVTFTLPSPAPARLQLIDVTGRRLLARDVGEVGVGRHSLDLAPGRRLEPGLYWLRLEQGGREVRARVAVVE
ncbi:MAG TPA: T9SS type A sorting domain-containing protein, partial [Actinomycetota bacterium]|nr:T9SS type A sorting domain-containing protein [Actinomycetota bacterium]